MAKATGFNPVVRTVWNGGVMHAGKRYIDKALALYEGRDVLLDPIIDVNENCFSGFTVYNEDEIEICEFTLEQGYE